MTEPDLEQVSFSHCL